MKAKSIILLAAVVIVASGCLEVAGPIAKRPVEQVGPRRSSPVLERRLRLITRVEVTPRVVVNGDEFPGVITVDAYLTNREKTEVTLTDACLQLSIRGIHTNPHFWSGCTPTTIVLAPGETLRQQVELPDVKFLPDTYQFSASVLGYGFESPPVVIRVIRARDKAGRIAPS